MFVFYFKNTRKPFEHIDIRRTLCSVLHFKKLMLATSWIKESKKNQKALAVTHARDGDVEASVLSVEVERNGQVRNML